MKVSPSPRHRFESIVWPHGIKSLRNPRPPRQIFGSYFVLQHICECRCTPSAVPYSPTVRLGRSWGSTLKSRRLQLSSPANLGSGNDNLILESCLISITNLVDLNILCLTWSNSQVLAPHSLKKTLDVSKPSRFSHTRRCLQGVKSLPFLNFRTHSDLYYLRG